MTHSDAIRKMAKG